MKTPDLKSTTVLCIGYCGCVLNILYDIDGKRDVTPHWTYSTSMCKKHNPETGLVKLLSKLRKINWRFQRASNVRLWKNMAKVNRSLDVNEENWQYYLLEKILST